MTLEYSFKFLVKIYALTTLTLSKSRSSLEKKNNIRDFIEHIQYKTKIKRKMLTFTVLLANDKFKINTKVYRDIKNEARRLNSRYQIQTVPYLLKEIQIVFVVEVVGLNFVILDALIASGRASADIGTVHDYRMRMRKIQCSVVNIK